MPRPTAKPSALVLALVVAASIIGCGGGSTGLTKAEFIKRGDAICLKTTTTIPKDAVEYLEKHRNSLSEPPRLIHVKMVPAILLPEVRKEEKELRALGTPDGSSGEVAAIFAALDKAVKKVEANIPKNSQAAWYGNAFSETDRLARKYGFTQCVV